MTPCALLPHRASTPLALSLLRRTGGPVDILLLRRPIGIRPPYRASSATASFSRTPSCASRDPQRSHGERLVFLTTTLALINRRFWTCPRAGARGGPMARCFGDGRAVDQTTDADAYVDTAVDTDDALPPGLVMFCRTTLRGAYEHAAFERRRAMASRAPLALTCNEDDAGADVAADVDAQDPPDPTDGIEHAVAGLARMAREAAIDAAEAAEDDAAQTNASMGGEEEDDAEDINAKRRRVGAAGAAETSGAVDAAAAAAAAAAARAKKRARPMNASKWLNVHARALAAAMRGSWEMSRALVLTRELPVQTAVPLAVASGERSAWRRHVITTHHQALRARCAPAAGSSDAVDTRVDAVVDTVRVGEISGGVSTQAEGEAAWRRATGEHGRAALRDYAEAAEEVGNRPWVITALDWCAREAEGFLWRDGALDAALKSARRDHIHARGRRMTPEEEKTTRDELRYTLTMEGGGMVPLAGDGPDAASVKPMLVDVGSCWDYFRRYEETFEVKALDLCPRRARVMQCDFLELEIGAPDSAEVVRIPDDDDDDDDDDDACHVTAVPTGGALNPGNEAEPAEEFLSPGNVGEEKLTGPPAVLEALPAGCANVLVMSLVLSYVPTPRQRGEMIRRARELLADEGRGLLLIVTPHSTDKGHAPHKALPVLKEWKEAIESMGFERYRYERLRAVHAMAYRTVGAGGAKVASGMAPPMRIAFDGPDVDMTMPTAPAE